MRRIVVWTLVGLCALPTFAVAVDADVDGLRAYVAGRFDEVVVGLKR